MKNHLKHPKTLSFLLTLLLSMALGSSPATASEDVSFQSEVMSGLTNPVDVTVDSQGNIYVLDDKQTKVIKFDPYDQMVLDFGERGSIQDRKNR